MGGKLPSEVKQEAIPKVTEPNSGSIASKDVITTRAEEWLRIEKIGDTLHLVKVKG